MGSLSVIPVTFLFVWLGLYSYYVVGAIIVMLLICSGRVIPHILLTKTCTATFYDDHVELTLNNKEYVINYLDVKKVHFAIMAYVLLHMGVIKMHNSPKIVIAKPINSAHLLDMFLQELNYRAAKARGEI